MAKKPAKSNINVELLTAIASGSVGFISQPDGTPLLGHNPPLIQVNTQQLDTNGNAAVRISPEGQAYLANLANAPADTANGSTPSPFAIIKGVELPVSKRGNKGGGAPTQYPFEAMQVGESFFVPVSEKHEDPVKTLGSTVSAMNFKFSEPTGEKVEVERTKRGKGNRAELDAAGNKIKVKVMVDKRKPIRKFAVRPVTAGTKYGNWTPDQTGAVVSRIL